MLKWMVCLTLFSMPAAAEKLSTVDYALVEQREAWLRHPVYGDASFDSFTHHAKNPVHRGTVPYEWPVNGSLFNDPISENWFLYVGHYRTGYQRDLEHPSRATVFRSNDAGEHWEDLGAVFPAKEHTFAGEQSPMWFAPDVAVTYDAGRYHMSFDWATKSSTWETAANPSKESNSGSGYAWATTPEGPYHRIAQPIAATREQALLKNKYKRIYASTILKREKDWIVLTLTDSGPNFGWAYLGMTATSPEGPYTEPKLVLYPERKGFHPPLMEFHPSFMHEGYIYAPATSVALNRNFQMLWRVPIEEAMSPDAWEIFQHGSMWHADPVEHEAYGIWGQTFSGFIDEAGRFQVMYPSRDSQGMGTINTASRSWDTPYRERGFYVSGHEGPSFVRLKRGGQVDEIAATLDVHGTVTLAWNAQGPVGPKHPRSNATLHPLMLGNYTGLRLDATSWSLVSVDARGVSQTIATGAHTQSGRIDCAIRWGHGNKATLMLHNKKVWSGPLAKNKGALGIVADPFSNSYIDSFKVRGKASPGRTEYLHTEAILGAAQTMNDWVEVESEEFRYGIGVVSQAGHIEAKWNVIASEARLWAPTGPEYGSADVYLDGELQGRLNFHAETPISSKPMFTFDRLGNKPHSISLHNPKGTIPVDILEVKY
jgi:hypothetical protein